MPKVSVVIPTYNRAHLLNRISLRRSQKGYAVKEGLRGKIYLDLADDSICRDLISNELTMSKYVRIDKINDPRLLSRDLAAELIITDRS